MKEKRNIYLNTVDIEEAKEIFHAKFADLYTDKVEKISVIDSLNRMLSKSIFAKISNPHYNASAMDGIAVKADITYGAHERNPIKLNENIDFIYVDTGDYISEKYNAVIMIEDVFKNDDGSVNIFKSSHPWEHVRVVGEDIAVGDMILPTFHKIKPVDIGAILSAGITEIEVLEKISVGIIPTGSEIVNPGSKLKPGNIIDSNSRVFENMVLEAGGKPNRYEPVIDDRDLLKSAIIKAVSNNDIVVINAGSSAGTEDYTSEIIEELGEVYVHGIAIKPGKPTILGKIDNKPVIGIPGYPVSAFISFKEFVVPFVQGYNNFSEKNYEEVVLSKRIVSALKHREYVRMKLGKVGDKIIGTPLSRGAGVTMSLVKADGILSIPKNIEGYEAGTIVNVELLRPIERINGGIVSIGSHDIIMDHINDIMAKNEKNYNLSSAHVGSLGGIMATRKGETHIAPVHLLDEETGIYNERFVKKYIKNKEVILLKGIQRWQGLYVQKGNPLNIKSLKDIVDNKYIFANRQKGSGTRTLLDYYLKKEELVCEDIIGYEREFTTHTNVALSVKTGNSQVGLGIESVAALMELDFIPFSLEDYDFLIAKEYLENENIKEFINILKSKEFNKRLELLGGYVVNEFKIVEI